MEQIANKLTVLLGNKELLAELIKDEEVQVRIKDAVIDSLTKRFLQKSYVIDAVSEKVMKEIFIPNGFYDKKIDDKYKEQIEDIAKTIINDEVYAQTQSLIDRVNSEIKYIKCDTLKKLDKIDVEAIIRDEVRKTVNDHFK